VNLRKLKPIFVNNSIVPKILSFFAPIEINSITIFPFVFSRGVPSERTKTHETIHFQQYIETGVIGFYFLYFWDYLRARIKGKSGKKAYVSIRAEREAYKNDSNSNYLLTRKRWNWLKTN
tara:strand:- start:181 stop:540 length:360 start_codon:yes stop_codon:yes gene_type:complete